MKNTFHYILLLFLLMTVISCKTISKTENQTKQFYQDDFVGKMFEKQNDKTPAIYGGAPFLLFEANGEVHVKVSDMIEIGTYKIEDNQIHIKASLYNATFKILDNKTLQEKNGTWVLKK